MIHQKSKDFVYLISQTSHAWLSGQLARAWGNDHFTCFEPFSEISLAAEQHDIGWIEWEQEPQIDSKTGSVFSFMDMPFPSHLEIWEKGSRWASTINKYAALLISRHNTFLLGMHDFSGEPEDYERLAGNFRKKEEQYQNDLIHELSKNPAYQDYVREPWLPFNQKLIRTWDYFSLVLCMGLESSETIREVPFDFHKDTELQVSLKKDRTFIVNPWPFKWGTFEVFCEAKRLPYHLEKSDHIRQQLVDTPAQRLSFVLTDK